MISGHQALDQYDEGLNGLQAEIAPLNELSNDDLQEMFPIMGDESMAKRANGRANRSYTRMQPKSTRSRTSTTMANNGRFAARVKELNSVPMKAGDIVKILQKIANRKGISLANKTLRYGISRRSEPAFSSKSSPEQFDRK